MGGPSRDGRRPLEPGAEATVEVTVNDDMTAVRTGSGTVAVLATPQVVAMAERAAVLAVDGRLPEGATSVGASVTLDHVAPTPVGVDVSATARLDRIEGRKLHFAFSVRDRAGEVARGRHVRVLVDRSSFERTARARVGTEPPAS